MTSPAAIQADYCDLRFIKSRKVCQIVVEIPIEAGGAFVAAFGTPDPSKGVPIALARIDQNTKAIAALYGKETEPERKGGKLAQRAGILCSEGGFQRFVAERVAKMAGMAAPVNNIDPEDVAVFVRNHCGVESRAELDHDVEAARKFNDLEMEYKAWKVAA